MISLSRVNAKMGKNYYTQDAYYTKENGVENSEWFGLGAKIHNLSGQIDADTFQNLLNDTAKNSNAKNGESARVAIDLTFSAPKSVSLAGLVGGDKRIIEAHNKAVNTALKAVEERFSWTRTGSKENRQVKIAGNITAAKFMHDVSRAKDPQLHTHCVVLNKVQRADGQWRSLHNDGVFNNSKYLGFVYQNELAYELKQIGYDIQIKQNGTFEIKGYDEKQLQEFSKRTKKINELNCKTKKQERAEKLLNRPSKGKAIPREILLEKWKGEAESVGIKQPAPIKQKTNITIKEAGFEAQLAQKSVRDGIAHASERDVRFKKEELEKFVLSQNIGQIKNYTYQMAIDKLKQNGELIEYKKGYFTTKNALLIESRIISSIEVGKDKFKPIVENGPKQNLNLNDLNLTKGQKDALDTSLKTPDQFIAWQGVAGSGKTHAMKILREIAMEQGFQIRGFAPSAEAAQTLENDSKISSNTVASLLVKDEPKIFNHGNKEIWVVDEAGLLGARDCDKLMEKATYQNARVIFVGDTKQMSAVEAGNPFKLMQEKGIQTVYLNESKRQKTAILKESVDLIASHKVLEGLSKIRSNIVEIKDDDKKFDFIEKEYTKLNQKEQDKTLILAATNDERKKITDRIRTTLTEQGKLKDHIQSTHLVAKNQSTQERKSILNHNIGDVLIFYKDHKKIGVTKESQYVVRDIDVKNEKIILQEKNDPSNKQIFISPKITSQFINYEERKIDVAVGDKIRCTKNDSKMKIRNGQSFYVTSTQNNQITLKSASGRTLTFSNKNPVHLEHDYVNTVYSSQGKTCDRVIISGSKSFGKEMLYVALSRAEFSAVIVTQDRSEFMSCTQVSKAKVSAIELVKKSDLKNRPPQSNQTYHVDNSYIQTHFNQNKQHRISKI